MDNDISIYLDKNSSKPLYIQLYEGFRKSIEAGKLVENEKLPSIRNMADTLGVNNITVVNAYKLLESKGFAYSKKGSGTYVKKVAEETNFEYLEDESMDLMTSGILTLSENSINFASVSPTPDLFPVEEFKQVLIEILERDKGKAFVYPEINGYGPLRSSISKFLEENYSIIIDPEEIQITSGGQQGIDIIAKTLIEPGDYVFLENPTYSGAVAAFQSRGAKIIGIPILEDGINIETLKKNIKQYPPKFLYTMPNYQSPTSYSYSNEKKKELIKLANENNFFIIEDDFLSDLTYDGENRFPLKAIDEFDKVIYIKSFSKILMPGLRIGILTAPRKLFKSIIKAKHTTDISSSGFIQRAFDLYLRKGFWKEHICNIKKDYKEKYELMIREANSLKKYGISFKKPGGGLSLWLKLPKELNAYDLYSECMKKDILIVPGKIFFINEENKDTNWIRLSFASLDKNQIKKGFYIINKCIESIKYNKEDRTRYVPLI